MKGGITMYTDSITLDMDVVFSPELEVVRFNGTRDVIVSSNQSGVIEDQGED